jgi:hypothetical protein
MENNSSKIPDYNNVNLESKELAFTYWGTMKYFQGLIRSSELKAGLILSFYGILFNFVYKHIEDIKENNGDFWWFYALLVVWATLTIISMFFSVRTFIPRIMKEYKPNVFFFGDIISKFGDVNEFSKVFLHTNIDKKQLYDQLGQQIFINAKITTAKFGNVNKSVKFMMYSLVVLIVVAIVEIINAIFIL